MLDQTGCFPPNSYLLLDPFKAHSFAGGAVERNAACGSSSNDNWNQGEELIAELEEELYP